MNTELDANLVSPIAWLQSHFPQGARLRLGVGVIAILGPLLLSQLVGLLAG